MFALIDILLIAIGIALAVPVLTLLVEIVAGAGKHRASVIREAPRPHVAVLVPAHNEETALVRNLGPMLRQLEAGDRLIVIADNCSDDTANVARAHGAEVTERFDLARRGKGYALDHGLDVLRQTGAPDIVVCVDADCQLGPDSLDHLARVSRDTHSPVQAAYIMRLPQPAGGFARIVAFAWLVKDYVRPLGLRRMGFPCQLAGTGMAFPWHDICAVDLKNANLVEDLALGLDLALAGKFPRFCPGALVISDVAAGGMPSFAQRARWEHGAIATAVRYVPLLIGRFWSTRHTPLAAMMLDLIIPPLAFLVLLLASHVVLAALFYAASAHAAPLWLAAVNIALLASAVGVAWRCYGRDVVSLRTMTLAPFYVLSKVPLYLRLFVNRQTEWVRGNRGS